MLNLNDVYYFAHVVERKGFAAAGRVLQVPKSTLSKRIAALEKSLGVRLILRNARSFTVSKVGQEFYTRAAAMLRPASQAAPSCGRGDAGRTEHSNHGQNGLAMTRRVAEDCEALRPQ